MPQIELREAVDIVESAATLTDVIHGRKEVDLREALRRIAREIGVSNVGYVRFGPDKGSDAATAIATYSRQWQEHYLRKGYAQIDPVLLRGRNASLPFDWETSASDDPTALAFLADAAMHGVGRNGLTIPVRNRMDMRSLVSFSSVHSGSEWIRYKREKIVTLQKLSVLIASAANVDRTRPSQVELSRREEQCLIRAARGKKVHEIADDLDLAVSLVKAYLDTARHKLHCIDLSQAVAVAVATRLIPATTLQ
jgi:DNA-binding CsgD family transcriptional regulator